MGILLRSHRHLQRSPAARCRTPENRNRRRPRGRVSGTRRRSGWYAEREPLREI